MTVTADDLVRREVYYCVSALVSTLAGANVRMSNHDDARYDADARACIELGEQAFELCLPIDDYEEAAIQAGWQASTDQNYFNIGEAGGPMLTVYADSWQDLCEEFYIEPYQREVFEHWIISDWLADKLAEKGEKVDKDFAGMTVWARTTSGQGIASDSVIEAIAADLARA